MIGVLEIQMIVKNILGGNPGFQTKIKKCESPGYYLFPEEKILNGVPTRSF
jgi:hypothetical protein